MLHFESDYIAGAHPKVLEALIKSNLENLSGYGSDTYTASAKRKIAERCGNREYEVELLSGGTQTNAIVIASLLKDFEGVIAPVSGHINAHEAGAVEYSGKKIIPLPSYEGKVKAGDLKEYLEGFYADENREHMVFPGMLYISFPTEYGTLYSANELEKISEICGKFGVTLFIDGARLGYGLASRECDLTLEEIARLSDVFYIGGTKVGALCGEAVVFTKGNKPPHFLSSVKKRCGLLAKGRLLGVQFDALFSDELYFEISEYAIKMAEKLKSILKSKGYRLFIDSPTNQQFPIVPNEKLEILKQKVGFSFWEKYDNSSSVIRLATSWSTREEELEKLDEIL